MQLNRTPLPTGVRQVKLRVEQTTFSKAHAEFKAHGVSEAAFLNKLRELGLKIAANTYPDLFFVVDSETYAGLEAETNKKPCLGVLIGTSQGLGLSETEARDAFSANTGASPLILQ